MRIGAKYLGFTGIAHYTVKPIYAKERPHYRP